MRPNHKTRNATAGDSLIDRELPELRGTQPERLRHLKERIKKEFKVDTPVGDFLAEQLAESMIAATGEWAMEAAVRRRLAINAIPQSSRDELLSTSDLQLSVTATSDALLRVAAYRRGVEKSRFRLLKLLRDLSDTAETSPPLSDMPPALHFEAEAECHQHLVNRILDQSFVCPVCDKRSGAWLENRQRWQCSGCRRQLGVRAGTLMERSKIPLLKWFQAIEIMLRDPDTATSELMKRGRISRIETARTMKLKINQARATENFPTLVAGLNHVFAIPD